MHELHVDAPCPKFEPIIFDKSGPDVHQVLRWLLIDFLAWIKIKSEQSVRPTLEHTQGTSPLVSMQTSMMRSTTVQSRTSSRTSAFTASRACPKARKQVVVSAQVRRGASSGKSAGLRSALQTVLGSDLKSALLRTGRGQN